MLILFTLLQLSDVDSSVLTEPSNVVRVPLPFLPSLLNSHCEVKISIEMREWQVEEFVTAKHDNLLHEVSSPCVLLVPLVEDLITRVDCFNLCFGESVVIIRLWWVQHVPEPPVLIVEIPLAREGYKRDANMPDFSVLEDGAEDLEVHGEDVNDSSESVEGDELPVVSLVKQFGAVLASVGNDRHQERHDHQREVDDRHFSLFNTFILEECWSPLGRALSNTLFVVQEQKRVSFTLQAF
jgi:hypothetical protein